jgi:tRNA dimethylallyltransferase
LDARINARVVDMIQAGLVAEVRLATELSATAVKAIGVPEVRRHLAGEATLDETTSAIQLATRQYARRQEKWFRREKEVRVLPMSAETCMESACEAVMAMFPTLERGSE